MPKLDPDNTKTKLDNEIEHTEKMIDDVKGYIDAKKLSLLDRVKKLKENMIYTDEDLHKVPINSLRQRRHDNGRDFLELQAVIGLMEKGIKDTKVLKEATALRDEIKRNELLQEAQIARLELTKHREDNLVFCDKYGKEFDSVGKEKHESNINHLHAQLKEAQKHYEKLEQIQKNSALTGHDPEQQQLKKIIEQAQSDLRELEKAVLEMRDRVILGQQLKEKSTNIEVPNLKDVKLPEHPKIKLYVPQKKSEANILMLVANDPENIFQASVIRAGNDFFKGLPTTGAAPPTDDLAIGSKQGRPLTALAAYQGERLEGGDRVRYVAVFEKEIPADPSIPGDTGRPARRAILEHDHNGRVIDRTTDQLTPEEKEQTAVMQARIKLANYNPEEGALIITGGEQHTEQACRVCAALLLLRREMESKTGEKIDVESELEGCKVPKYNTFLHPRAIGEEAKKLQRAAEDNFIKKWLPSRAKDSLLKAAGEGLSKVAAVRKQTSEMKQQAGEVRLLGKIDEARVKEAEANKAAIGVGETFDSKGQRGP